MENPSKTHNNASNDIYRAETAIRRCSSKQIFLKFLQYLQENASVGVTF